MQWGELKGKYVGKISFSNGSQDAFTFTLTPEESGEYLALIAKKIGAHAAALGQQVIESIKLLPIMQQPILTVKTEA